MLYEFRDKLFLEYRNLWFVWESAWEGFRPIETVEWDGTTFRIKDDLYCSDPLNPHYGYGSAKMHELCDLLEDHGKETPHKVQTLPIGTEWFRDRFVKLTPCAPRDAPSWKRMVQGKGRTCRRPPRGKKFTRRINPKTK